MKFASTKLALLSISVLLFTASCKKDKDEPQANGDYAPMTAGSTWTYEDGTGGTNTVTATSRDTSINAKTYRVFTNSAGPNTYQAKVGADYYRFAQLEGLPGMEDLFLKDGQPLNGVWSWAQNITVPGVPFPVNVSFAYTVKEKDVTRTVLSNTFNNVLRVGVVVSYSTIGFPVTQLGTGDTYYAKGIGMIESNIAIDFMGTIETDTQKLKSYDIK